ncbi:MAG: hypothetical protein AB7R67_21760 [Vicinamibacterales bacterium]
MSALERLHVRLPPGETLDIGNYTVRVGAAIHRHPVADRCPYCTDPMVEFETAGAMRVATIVTPLTAAGVIVLGVHAKPDDLRLLKCQACDQFFSTAREAA